MATRDGTMKGIGWGITVLVSALFVMSAVMKFMGGPQIDEGMAKLGLAPGQVKPLGAVELACVAFYLVPATTVLGAILLTGYMGGTIMAHLHVGEPFVFNVAIGVFVWLGIYFRCARLREILPLRR